MNSFKSIVYTTRRFIDRRVPLRRCVEESCGETKQMASFNLQQMKVEGKKLPLSSLPHIYFHFVFTVLILVPLLLLLLPIVLISLLIQFIQNKLSSSIIEENQNKLSNKSEIITKQTTRQYDLVFCPL